jgi:urease accessory protein
VAFFLALAVGLGLPVTAHAHTGTAEITGFCQGMAHPLGGLDHVLAMLAVGLWAAQLRGRALWAVPAAFTVMMVLGSALPMFGLSVPFVEQGILFSVLALGVLVAAAVRLPVVGGMALVGAFAFLHGFAHGAEMPATESGALYGAGFLLATALLHAFGIAAGLSLQRASLNAHHVAVRFAGLVVLLGGVYRMC